MTQNKNRDTARVRQEKGGYRKILVHLMHIITEQNRNSPPALGKPISIGLLSNSPIGPLWIALSDLGIVLVDWSNSQEGFTRFVQHRFNTNVIFDEARTSESIRQLSEYLSGTRRDCDLTIDLTRMSQFQAQVLKLTMEIKYGRTSTYKDIAATLGNPLAARAVGRVEATNPIPLILPCHRVIGSDGNLHGYGGPGGIKLKAWLLKLEQSRGI